RPHCRHRCGATVLTVRSIEPRFVLYRTYCALLDLGQSKESEHMAVILWGRHQRGDRTALELLLQYNREDVVNLEVLMEHAFRMQQERLLPVASSQ
ncbi:MAG: ribonuclease H-like domain-containing protein, partial [Desulfobaccales bacterium]